MKTERFYLKKNEPPITPTMLREDPDKYGGLGIHMLHAIQEGVITIALIDNPSGGSGGSCVSIKVTDEEVANRIIRDNGVEIQSDRYWVNILSTRPVFVGTDEAIPMWGVSVGDSLAKAGFI